MVSSLYCHLIFSKPNKTVNFCSAGMCIATKATYGTMQQVQECKNMVFGLHRFSVSNWRNISCICSYVIVVIVSPCLHYLRLTMLLRLFVFWAFFAGIDQVVLGDLVYCKGEHREKVAATIHNSECEDDSCNDMNECSQLDEICETVFPEEISNSVKVWYFELLELYSMRSHKFWPIS